MNCPCGEHDSRRTRRQKKRRWSATSRIWHSAVVSHRVSYSSRTTRGTTDKVLTRTNWSSYLKYTVFHGYRCSIKGPYTYPRSEWRAVRILERKIRERRFNEPRKNGRAINVGELPLKKSIQFQGNILIFTNEVDGPTATVHGCRNQTTENWKCFRRSTRSQ